VPVVLLQEETSIPGVFTVSAEDEAGAEEIVVYVHALGHRRLAFVSGDPPWPGPERRRAAFFRTAERLGLEASEWTSGAYTIEATRELLRRRSLGRPGDPTALVVANDVMALGVMQHAQEMGLAIPRDLSVVGFNDYDFASWVRPAITTVRLPGVEMGARAFQLLVAAVESGTAIQAVRFRVELVIRETTGPRPAYAATP
jgi:DNA-binding LacI/PurR family transcriptional regulator